MLTESTQRLVRESWELARRDAEGLTVQFYEDLFAAAPSVRALFPGDMRRQRRKLAETLDMAVMSISNLNTILMDLSQLAERHVGYGALAEHYPAVGDALIGALKKQLGDDFTRAHEEAWGVTYDLLSSVMIDAQAAASV